MCLILSCMKQKANFSTAFSTKLQQIRQVLCYKSWDDMKLRREESVTVPSLQ
jgi:hypothetical protein